MKGILKLCGYLLHICCTFLEMPLQHGHKSWHNTLTHPLTAVTNQLQITHRCTMNPFESPVAMLSYGIMLQFPLVGGKEIPPQMIPRLTFPAQTFRRML